MKFKAYFKPAIGMLFLIVSFSIAVEGQGTRNPFDGLKHEHMVNTLQDFKHRPGRWNVPAIDGRLLYDIIKKNGYQRVLEIGTSNGYSGLWMGFALKETGGHLITLEINEQRAKEARNNFKEAGLASVIEVRLNDARKEIPHLSGNFDFIFLDADKSEYLHYYKMLKPRLHLGGAISAHNVTNMEYSMEDFLQAIRNDKAFEVKVYEASNQGILVATKKTEAGR